MKKQKGFVSTEIGIAIFVVSMLTLAGFLASQFLVNDSNSATLANQSQDTVRNIRSKYRYQGDFTGLSTTQVITLNAAPRTMVNGTDTLINTFGGQMSFTPTSCTGTSDCFEKTQTRLPYDACINYANAMLDISDKIRVNSTDVKDSGEFTIDQNTLSGACTTADNQIITSHTRA